MIFFKYIVAILCLVLLSTLVNAKDYSAVDIRPVSSGWNDAKAIDVKAVATSVASNLMPYFPKKRLNPIILKNKKEGPKTLYEKGNNNEYIVFVDIKSRKWAQLSYQFSHELCHILSNYNNDDIKNQWLEESLCEAISLHTLEKMSIQWQHTPPYPNWKSYSSHIKKYLNNMLQEKHRGKSDNLSKWFSSNKKSLESNPYLRNKNEVVGTAIYRLIKTGNFKVSTIQYLNLGLSKKDKNISTKLNDWYKNSPKENKESVLSIAKLLGVKI